MYTSFTSESVCSGHPDKICDQISDAILDAALAQDPFSRVAVEALVTTDYIMIAGEITTLAKLRYKTIVRRLIKRLGYTDPELKFTYNSPINFKLHTQSNEIAVGVDDQGAGDQGLMYGFACRETESLMPLPISIAHALTARLDSVREDKVLAYLRPDGKAQVTVSYYRGIPKKITHIVLAAPHMPDITLEQVKDDLYREVITPVLLSFGFKIKRRQAIINGTGVWHFSGPAADTGITGRKIVVDAYGSMANIGGGAFSGKDPTKVDRSGAYAARFLAKNIVHAGLADRAEVRLAYFIGAKKPVMQEVETFGTEHRPRRFIKDYIFKLLDTSVSGIIKGLELQKPIYLQTAVYGHFGREIFPWEKLIQ